MFYFLRIFHPTAAFIRMITEVIKDMSIFTFMLFIALLAFTNSFYILDGGFSSLVPVRATGDTFWQAFSLTYMTGLGEWETGNHGASSHTIALWIYFVLTTLFIQIIFLNMLIAIIADTFDKVQEIKE
jgi:hypothetical protein